MANYPSADFAGGSRSPSIVTSPHIRSRSRAQSISSDRPSNSGLSMMAAPPLIVSPEAAFVAPAAASQIVTNDHDNHANQWYDQDGIEPSGETAMVSDTALQLVNNFLDQLLYSFLYIARSTSLSALRPAVTEVLKPKLAKDAINQADEELREYLGGGDDEDMLRSQTPRSPRDWDLELVWKRTRLRCMVYSSLGDMEEEDEDFYMEQENLDGGDEALGETVSPAVAIFLTSILEFMGEQALASAGQAAYHRTRFLLDKGRKDNGDNAPTVVAERITVDEVDMERVAFDRTMGRLWRAWKKRIRTPATDVYAFQPRSPQDVARSRSSQRRAGIDEVAAANGVSEKIQAKDVNNLEIPALSEHTASAGSPENNEDGDESKDLRSLETPSLSEHTTSTVSSENTDDAVQESAAAAEPALVAVKNEDEWLAAAASTPLPDKLGDVADILFPGLAYHSDDEDYAAVTKGAKKQKKSRRIDPSRPKSIMIFSPSFMAALPTPSFSASRTPDIVVSRKRAYSLPTPLTSLFKAPAAKRVKPSEDNEAEEGGKEGKEVAGQLAEGTHSEAVAAESQAKTEVVEETTKAVDEEPKAVPSPPVKHKQRPAPPKPLQTSLIGAAITTSYLQAVSVSSIKEDGGPGQEDADEIDEIDEFTEEPEILTSSRVSFSARSNSPTVSEPSRSASVALGAPARSPSLHSLRVIEVNSPRLPAARSRTGSSEFNELVVASRASNASRASSSISAQSIAEESTAVDAPRSSAPGAAMSRSQTSQTNESISESEEETAAVPTPAKSPVKQPQNAQAQLESSRPILGSSARDSPTTPVHPSSSSSPRVSPGSKVAVAEPTTTAGTFLLEEKPKTPPKDKPAEISLPERSAKRSGALAASATAATAAAAAAAVATTALLAPGPQAEAAPAPTLVTARSSFSSSRDAQGRDQVRAQLRADSQAAGRKPSVASLASSISKMAHKTSSEESTVMRPEEVARNFEQLIHSDQTIQFTLTPEGMRDVEATPSVHDGSAIAVKNRKSEDAAAARQAHSRASSINTRGEDKRSMPTARPSAPDLPVADSSLKRHGSVSQAREARVPRESLSEFNDFLRETGPSAGSAAPPATRTAPTPGSVLHAVRTMSGQTRPSLESGKAVANFSNRSRPRFEAREATVNKDDNSDLIDFIRRGPPADGSSPRIPRTVAPFRSTMDSEVLSGAVGGRAVDASIPDVRYSGTSTNVTESSTGSTAGLFKNGASQASSRTNGVADGMLNGMPKRKTRRVRDPYAIDLSDEEDEFDVAFPAGRRPPPPKEESLIDFLNSVPPPSERKPVPFSLSEARGAPPAPKKKASAPSLMSRFTRNSSLSGNHNSRNLVSSSGSVGGSSIFDKRSIASRAGSAFSSRARGHIPIEVNAPPGVESTLGTSTFISSTNPNASRPTASSSARVPMKRSEPREATSTSSRATQDLADFFRNSGPPQAYRN